MVIKFFANKKGGSSASIDYLLNERVSQGTARVLKGDEKVTRALIDSMTTKHKTCVGCLVFTEKEQISSEQKKQIMKEFEYALMPGMKDRINILWVEHTDKDNLELNFVIPKIDLESGKSFNPYYHKVDFNRLETFQELINVKYDLSNPKEPERQQSAKKLKFESIEAKNYKELGEILQELAIQGVIKNRDELIKECKNSNIEVTRQGDDYISLKLPNTNKAKKFKGGIYDKQFRGLESIAEQITDIETRQREFKQIHNSRNTKLIRELTVELNNEKRRKFKFNRGKFKKAKLNQSKSINDRTRMEISARDKHKENNPNIVAISRDFNGDNLSNIYNDNLQNNNLKKENDDTYRRYNQSAREQNFKIDEFMRENARQLQESRKRLRAIRKRLQRTGTELRETNTRATNENERNSIFTEFFNTTTRTFKSDIRNRIQEFKREFGEHIKTKLKELREQSQRDIKSSFVEVGKFIEKNKRKLERVLQRDRGISK